PSAAGGGTPHSYTQTVIGGQYTFHNNLNVVLEVYHGGDGLTRNEFRAFCSRVSRGDLLFGNTTYTPLKMARNYAFARLDLPSGKNEVELIGIVSTRDRSSIARLTLSRKVRPNVSAYIIDTEFFGARGSEFAYIQVKRATTFGARWYF
ncbi:MAG TPA: hypothetical protein VLU46_13550, partial [Thermoanaerobaculia bacterium]|nr:hypothetical protein [Thermoanaerobaculia bacterium]